MTIDEAIRVLTAYSDNMETDLIEPEYDAIKLGIEALGAVAYVRVNNYYTPIPPLPGETT